MSQYKNRETKSQPEEPKVVPVEAPKVVKGEEAPKPIQFGSYAYEFVASEAERLLCGNVQGMDKHTQKFVNFMLVASIMELRKRMQKIEAEFGL